jgi:hypothetical protein
MGFHGCFIMDMTGFAAISMRIFSVLTRTGSSQFADGAGRHTDGQFGCIIPRGIGVGDGDRPERFAGKQMWRRCSGFRKSSNRGEYQ